MTQFTANAPIRIIMIDPKTNRTWDLTGLVMTFTIEHIFDTIHTVEGSMLAAPRYLELGLKMRGQSVVEYADPHMVVLEPPQLGGGS